MEGPCSLVTSISADVLCVGDAVVCKVAGALVPVEKAAPYSEVEFDSGYGGVDVGTESVPKLVSLLTPVGTMVLAYVLSVV